MNEIGLKKFTKKEAVMFSVILIIVVIALFLGSLPVWSYSRSWGYYPTAATGILLLSLFILLLAGIL